MNVDSILKLLTIKKVLISTILNACVFPSEEFFRVEQPTEFIFDEERGISLFLGITDVAILRRISDHLSISRVR